MAPRHPTASQAPASLNFNEPLTWKAGKPPTIPILLKRLKALATELREYEQEDIDRDSLLEVAKDLCTPGLMQHKDKTVKGYVAVCLQDMLRLHAPDAPYTANQLRDIFNLFITELRGLSEPVDSPNRQQLLDLLTSLSQIKSIVLICDVPGADALITDLFKTFFDLAAHEGPKNIEYHMTELLIQLVDETHTIPPEAIEATLAQMLRRTAPISPDTSKKKKVDKAGKEQQTLVDNSKFSPPYNMAKSICTTCPDKMARYVCQYFSDVIINISSSATENPTEELSDKDLTDLKNAHLLVEEIYRATPEVLINVIPILEQELGSDKTHDRLIATGTIAAMASTGTFPTMSPSAWRTWLGRANDKNAAVRSRWTEGAYQILRGRTDVTDVLRAAIQTKLVDPDEKVRLTAVKGIGELDWSTVTTKLAGGNGPSALSVLADRVKDKRPSVRSEGMLVLAKLWATAFEEIKASNGVVVLELDWIPSKILEAVYVNDKETNVLIDHALYEQLLPIGDLTVEKKTKARKTKAQTKEAEEEEETTGGKEEDIERTERMLVLIRSLSDSRNKKAFFAIPKNQQYYAKVMDAYLKACEEYNGGITDEDEADKKRKLELICNTFAQHFPDATKVLNDLKKFALFHDRRCYELIRRCYSTESSYATVIEAIKLVHKKISTAPETKISSAVGASIIETMIPLLYRTSLLIYNKSHVPAIVEISRTDRNSLGPSAHEFLKEMSQSNPAIFKAHVKTLCSLIIDMAPVVTSKTPVAVHYDDSQDDSIVDTIKACSGFAAQYPKEMPQDRKLTEALINFALYTNSPAAAKHAVKIMMSTSSRKDMIAGDLLKKILKEWNYGGEYSLARLSTLATVVLMCPSEAERDDSRMSKILDIAVKEVLLKPRPKSSTPDIKDWDGTTAELVPESTSKLIALKILVNRCRACVEPSPAITDIPLKIMTSLLQNEGELLPPPSNTPKAHRSILRSAASLGFLKLARLKHYEPLISPTLFNRLALTTQDTTYPVRRAFIEKLKKHLATARLPPRYYTPIFLLAHEPQVEMRDETATWLRSRAKSLPEVTMEVCFSRLLSLLAHHPDFGRDVEDLKDFAGYLLYYLKSVATEENLSLIYYIAQRMKTLRDAVPFDADGEGKEKRSERLWVMSDLAQSVVRRVEEVRGWSMQSWPGKLALPAGLFTRFADEERQKAVVNQNFLPEGLEDVLEGLVKRSLTGRKRKSEHQDFLGTSATQTPAKKRTKSLSTSTSKHARTPKTPKSSKPARKLSDETPIRRSGRAKTTTKYAEGSDEEDEDEMDVDEEEEESEEEEEDNGKDESEKEEEEEEEIVAEDEEEELPKSAKKNGISKSKPTPKAKHTPKSKARTKAKSPASSASEAEDEEKEEQVEEEEAPELPKRSTRGKAAAAVAAAAAAAATPVKKIGKANGKGKTKTVISQRASEEEDE